jgi:hypothetical protein
MPNISKKNLHSGLDKDTIVSHIYGIGMTNETLSIVKKTVIGYFFQDKN